MRLLATTLIATALLAASCGDTTSEPASGIDSERTRTVAVAVTVVDEREPSDIEVRATAYRDVVLDRFAVPLVGTQAAHLGDTCAEAQERADRAAERLGEQTGPCEPVQIETTEAFDVVLVRTDDDGVATLGLLPGVDYEVWAGVPIVPTEGTAGCYWNGTATIDADTSAVEVHLDSDGCSGG